MVRIQSHTVFRVGVAVQVWFEGTLVRCEDIKILQCLLEDTDSPPLLLHTPAVFRQ